MAIDLSSLRGKITTAYIALVAAALVFALVAYLYLMFLERQVREGGFVSDLQDAVLEMHAEEKNLFLHSDQETLARLDLRAERALGIVLEHRRSLADLMQRSDPQTLIANLQAYRSRLSEWDEVVALDSGEGEKEIRAIGHRVYLSVESLASQERKMLEAAVHESQWFLLILSTVIVLAIFVVGHRLKSIILVPLLKLESHLKPIADGRFNRLQPPSNDREFLTFTDAFNRMLKELDIRQRRMLQSEKLASLGILASGVAHELNNPLSNISSSCQLLMEEIADGDTQQHETWLKQIDSETERGKKIVQTLLDFGRQKVFQKERARLLGLVNETQSLLRESLVQYSAKLSVNISPDLELAVDKQRIQQALINLIQNALHAGGNGVNVRISAIVRNKVDPMIPEGAEVAGNLNCVSRHEGPFVEILVADDGPGIPKETLPKVFDPFFTTSEPSKGAGLGMFIVQEIVREHDGCLAIVSRAQAGTKVMMLFPCEDPECV